MRAIPFKIYIILNAFLLALIKMVIVMNIDGSVLVYLHKQDTIKGTRFSPVLRYLYGLL